MKKILILGFLSAMCFMSCEREENSYYDVGADGYVINADTKEPIKNATIGVHYVSKLYEGVLGGRLVDTSDRFFVDSNGYFHVDRFRKRINKVDITGISIWVSPHINGSVPYIVTWGMDGHEYAEKGISLSILKRSYSTIIRIDTAKVHFLR